MAKTKAERFFCPRCRQHTTDTIAIGGSTFCASCLAGIESLIVANVPPVESAAWGGPGPGIVDIPTVDDEPQV